MVLSATRAGALAALACAVALTAGACGGSAGAGTDPNSRFDGAPWPERTPPPSFALRDQDGRVVRLAAQRGKFVIVTFLYTHCRDVCPLIATQLNEALRRLGRARDQVRVLAVSVDPRGDTRRSVRRFVREHALLPQFHYLTGSRRRLEPIWKGYHVAVDPHRLDDVDHSAYELLIDRSGHGRVVYTSDVKAGEVVHDLRQLGLS